MARHWLATLDRLWDRAQQRIDATAGEPLRSWLAPLGQALIATVALVGLTRLLLTSTAHGNSLVRWLGAAVAALLALPLLAVVTRNTIISLIEPAHRRLLLIAFLASSAALALSVEAFSAVTLAIGAPSRSLWSAERFYLWQLVDSIPLLRLTDRLQWTEPPLLHGVDGRALVLGFKLLVIPPLARVGLTMYGFIENRRVERAHHQAIATHVRGTANSSLTSSLGLFLLAPAAGVIWAGWGRAPLWSLTSLAVVAVAVAALVTTILVFALLNLLAELVLIPLLLAAVATVWFSPWFADVGFWAKVGLTIVAWFALWFVVLPFWETPELPQALVAFATLVGFVGADAPAGRWLAQHVSWQLANLPIGAVLATACAWYAVAFGAWLILQAPHRQPALGDAQLAEVWFGLRSDLRAYVLIGVHIVLGAATALTLLRAGGLAAARGPGDGLTSSSSSLVVAVWHVLDSLPGPSVPGVLEWRLTTDLTGRWAGLVIVLAVTGVVAFAALPLIRTVVLWARLTLSPPETATPATALAREVTDRLDAVISQLEANLPHDEPGAASPAQPFRPGSFYARVADLPHRQPFEQELVAVELALRQLRDVFGTGSAVYRAAHRAAELTAGAYRISADSRGQPSADTDLRAAVMNARAALDELWRALRDFRLDAEPEPATTA
ncbi:hypothetical protein [Micromonospora sp. NPDC005171]|uniref:hypothetical protein n=1 Tax=Micromonospora sp. NPDC005171 TaxID=3156866 RepID=UPI0033B37B79